MTPGGMGRNVQLFWRTCLPVFRIKKYPPPCTFPDGEKYIELFVW